jgi:hypothetical protein
MSTRPHTRQVQASVPTVLLVILSGGCGGRASLLLGSGTDTGMPALTPKDAALEATVAPPDTVHTGRPADEVWPSDGDAGDLGVRVETPGAASPDTITADDVPSCAVYAGMPRVDGDGAALYVWRFDWRQDNLASLCASYGDDARMVIEHRLGTLATTSALPSCTTAEVMGYGDHACAMAGWIRIEVGCTAGCVLFEGAGSYDSVRWGGPGYYHIESAQYPLLPRRLMISDKTDKHALHPRFVPMAPAGSPEVGTDTGIDTFLIMDYDPAENGQPCHSSGDCPSGKTCFVDAPVGDCQSGPIGHCVPRIMSNTCHFDQTCASCLILFGTVCSGLPGYACGLTSCGGGCLPPVDSGVDSL